MASSLTPEALVYGLKTAGDPQLSPDGTQIVYTLSQASTETKKVETQLWLCDRNGGKQRQLTQSGKSNAAPRWSPDGTQIAFVSDRIEDDRKGARALLVLSLAGGDAREVTRHGQGISNLAWSPDGASIAYNSDFDPDNPDEEKRDPEAAAPVRATSRIDYKQDGFGYLGDKRQQIFIVDVASGERRKLTGRPNDFPLPLWSPDGKTIAALLPNRNGMHGQLVLIDVATGAETVVGPEDGTLSSWSWSPSGDRVVYTGDIAQTWQPDFFVYHVDTGGSRRITEDLEPLPAGAFGGVASPIWLDDDRVLFSGARAGASGLYVIDLSDGEVELSHSHHATSGGLSGDSDNRYIVQTHASFDATGELSVYDRESGELNVITNLNEDFLNEHPPASWEQIEIEREGYTIESWLLKPHDFDESKTYPLVMTIHGGPNGHYGYGYESVQQILASNGFLVVLSNPRGSSSYGREFTLQVSEDWGGEDYKDLMAVVDTVLERPYADGDRTGIEGYSYGGYMTSWIIGQTQRFKACVCGAPCFDLESMYGTSDISHTFGELQWGGRQHQSPEWYRDHSPSTFAHTATTPTLIIHGEADERCPIGQGEQMFIALKKAGCEVEFARYPGGFHGFRRMGPPPHREDLLGRTLGWMKGHLA